MESVLGASDRIDLSYSMKHQFLSPNMFGFLLGLGLKLAESEARVPKESPRGKIIGWVCHVI